MSDIKSIANNPFTQYVKRVLGPDVVIPATDKEWDVFLIIAIYTNEYIYIYIMCFTDYISSRKTTLYTCEIWSNVSLLRVQ
jgi:hypothetical protein